MRELQSVEAVDEALAGSGIIFKHSSRCPVSYDAFAEIQQFESDHPEVPVHLVDVVLFRSLSAHIADATGIVHHSPQAIVVRHGAVVWHGSHYAVNALTLARHAAAA